MKSSNTVFASTTNGIIDAGEARGKAGFGEGKKGDADFTFSKACGSKKPFLPTPSRKQNFRRAQSCKRARETWKVPVTSQLVPGCESAHG